MKCSKLCCYLILVGLIIEVIADDSAGSEGAGVEGSNDGQDQKSLNGSEQAASNHSGMVLMLVQVPPKKLTLTHAQAQVTKWEIERANATYENATQDTQDSAVLGKRVATECVAGRSCFGDSDCATGRCLGIAVGKCNCGACLTFITCMDDAACGGLRGACDNQTKYCDCDRGFRANGFQTIFDAARLLCNVKDCSDRDSCYGLPCNAGFCAC